MERTFWHHNSSQHLGTPLGMHKRFYSMSTTRLLWIFGKQGIPSLQIFSLICMQYFGQLDILLILLLLTLQVLTIPLLMLFLALGHPFPTASPTFSTSVKYHPCMVIQVLEGILSHYQSLGSVTSIYHANKTGLRAFQQFCCQFTIPAIL